MEPRPYPRVRLEHDEWDILKLTYTRIEGDQKRSFQYAQPFTEENWKGMNDAVRLLVPWGKLKDPDFVWDGDANIPLEALMQCAQNMVALANGVPLVPRGGPPP